VLSEGSGCFWRIHSDSFLCKKVLAATKDLRTERGRISAKLIAGLYDLDQAELARWLGK
jgi:hypothetical protein